MSVKLNQEIWLYVERLYTHCYGFEDFKLFLKKYGIEYDNPDYFNLNQDTTTDHKPLYVFMSEPNYFFANFMQTIPSYKYLPILEKIVFDPKIIATRIDGWNYYGESIRNWHPKIVDILKTSDVHLDTDNKKLLMEDQEKYFEGPDFLPYDFNDLFLDYIRREINESYNNGQLLAVIVLSRKLLEALVLRIFEVVFPKIECGSYNQLNHELWYQKNRGRHHGLEILLQNLKSKSDTFDEDKELLEQTCEAVDLIRQEANKCVHKDYKIPNEMSLKQLNLESSVASIRKLYKKYCNP